MREVILRCCSALQRQNLVGIDAHHQIDDVIVDLREHQCPVPAGMTITSPKACSSARLQIVDRLGA